MLAEEKEEWSNGGTRGGMKLTRAPPAVMNPQQAITFVSHTRSPSPPSPQDSQLGAYVNTVVVQHDDDLIFPGDLAFDLRCHDQVTVNASLAG